MKPKKMKSLSEAKLKYGFLKNVKFHFCPVFLGYGFTNNFIVRFMYEDVRPLFQPEKMKSLTETENEIY